MSDLAKRYFANAVVKSIAINGLGKLTLSVF